MLSRVQSDGEYVGALRTAEGKDGSTQVERLIESAPERRLYRYRMESSKMPVRDYIGQFQVQENTDGTSTVIWSAEFEPVSDEQRATVSISAFLRTGLDNVAALYGNNSVTD